MPDDPIIDVAPAPVRRRPKLTVMPALPNVAQEDRDAVVRFMKDRLQQIERDYQERLDLIKSGGEHPMPIYSRLVHNHAAMGLPKTQIAKLLGITVTILKIYYSDDFELGIAQINLKIASNVARKALSDDPDAAKVGLDWLDRRGGDEWRKSTQKIAMVEDKPSEIDPSQLTYEQRQQLRAMLLAVADGQRGEALRPEETPEAALDASDPEP